MKGSFVFRKLGACNFFSFEVTGIVDQEEIESPPPSLWIIPEEESRIRKLFWFYSWPIRFILTCTIPNPRTYRSLYWLTFIICIIYIGLITYFIFWMMVVIGMLLIGALCIIKYFI